MRRKENISIRGRGPEGRQGPGCANVLLGGTSKQGEREAPRVMERWVRSGHPEEVKGGKGDEHADQAPGDRLHDRVCLDFDASPGNKRDQQQQGGSRGA